MKPGCWTDTRLLPIKVSTRGSRRDNRFGTAVNYDEENVQRTFTGVMFHVHLVASGKLLEISTLRDMTKAHLTLGGLLREEKQTSKKFN